MFLLATRGRPDECRGLLAAMEATGHVPEVAVWIDGDPDTYDSIKWPAHWHIHRSTERVEMTKAINSLIELHPGQKFYGMFGDHFRPLTPVFPALADAVGDWFMAWPSDDGEMSHVHPAGVPTFGAKLVEALGGWVCLPSTIHVSTERPWWLIWKELGILYHLENEKFTRTWPHGQGRVVRDFKGLDYNHHDRDALNDWLREMSKPTIEHIRNGMIADGYRFENGRIAPEYGCTEFQDGW